MKLQEIIRNNSKFAVIAAASFLIDEGMKNCVEEYDVLDTPKEILDGKAVLRRYHNKGAFLNFGEQKRKLVTLLSVLLTVAVLVVFVLTLGMRGKKLLKAGLSLLLGGAFSNTYDRVMREYVVDYVSLKTGIAAIDRVVFNLADLCILIGTLAVVLGTEGDGLSDGTIAACDYTVRIPMTHGVDSLNVAAASAVAFYQLGLMSGGAPT